MITVSLLQNICCILSGSSLFLALHILNAPLCFHLSHFRGFSQWILDFPLFLLEWLFDVVFEDVLPQGSQLHVGCDKRSIWSICSSLPQAWTYSNCKATATTDVGFSDEAGNISASQEAAVNLLLSVTLWKSSRLLKQSYWSLSPLQIVICN